MTDFTPDSLVDAVRTLLTLNNYNVSGPQHIYGAEIDLIAKHKASPFSPTLYLEITVQYVDTEKYGKDFSKLGLFRETDPSGELIIISATGFTKEVKERALHSRVRTLTYQELLGSFEQFGPYLTHTLFEGASAEELARLSDVYQVPFFNDTHGRHETMSWLDEWMRRRDPSDAWLVVVGEYGTGKTALTQMMQKRWLEAYRRDPGSPIPFRIELGSFTRQFDADGLIHHFLDRNNLGHIPLAYVWSLIRTGRVVLLLDAYDEMAQYLSARERRTCLRTLAELTSDGARGLMTSRPNYFSEQEELNVFDILYRSLSVRSEFLVNRVESLQREEEKIDEFISRSLLDKYERTIEDLTPLQTEDLVRTKLSNSPEQADAVISILHRVFRSDGEGSLHALSGKPVIISYLIEVADRIALRSESNQSEDSLSEWAVYEMILEQLALRDLTHTERVSVRARLDFLGSLAVMLNNSGAQGVNEDQFRDLIEKEFDKEIRRRGPERRGAEIESYFDDLRRSGSLSRRQGQGESIWTFSHNSIREFLAAQRMVDKLLSGDSPLRNYTVTDAMRIFVSSLPDDHIANQCTLLSERWLARASNPGLGSYTVLLWDAIDKLWSRECAEPIERITGSPMVLEGLRLSRVDFARGRNDWTMHGADFRSSELSSVNFSWGVIVDAKFSSSLLDGVSFKHATLQGCSFEAAALLEVDLSGTQMRSCSFKGLDPDSSIIVDEERLDGPTAIGYLRYLGSETDDIDDIYVWRNSDFFPIVEKIAMKLLERPQRQRLGLTQKGASALNPGIAERFVKIMERAGHVRPQGGRADIVELLPSGRTVFGNLISGAKMDSTIAEFLRDCEVSRR